MPNCDASVVPNLGSSRPLNISTFLLGKSNMNKRVWLQTRYLERIGFQKDELISIDFSKKERTITINKDQAGNRKVSGRPNGLPIIDIKNKLVSDTLGDFVEKITVKFYLTKIVISVATNEALKAARRAKTSNKAIEIFSGGGTLAKFAEMAGFKLDTAIELQDKYVEVFERNIDCTTTICANVNDVDVMDLPTDCTHLQFGYPCTAYSTSNVVLKKKFNALEADAIQECREADYLSLALCDIIKHVNPRSILIEEVPEFANSLPFDLLTYALEKMDYKISVRAVSGSFTNRKRIAIVAIADHEALDISEVTYQDPRSIESHLKTPLADRAFLPIEMRPRESGALRKGLGIRSHLPSDLKISTITTHWTRHTHASLRHPFKADHYSDFTVDEVRSLHGLPAGFDCGDKVTTARAVLGQGVVDGFLSILSTIYSRVCEENNQPKVTPDVAKFDMGQLALAW